MTAMIHAAWFHDHGNDADALHGSLGDYQRLLHTLDGLGRTGAYVIDPGGADMQWVKSTVAHLDDHPAQLQRPSAFVVAEIVSMADALALGRQLSTSDGPADHDSQPFGIFSQALFQEIAYIPGPEEQPDGPLGDAVQLGTFSVKEVRDEWRLSEWYEYTRHVEVATIPGAIRTRRLVSICGRAKFGVLYEFTSLVARLEGFEKPMEGRFQDHTHPTSQLGHYTVHAPGAPYVGCKVA